MGITARTGLLLAAALGALVAACAEGSPVIDGTRTAAPASTSTTAPTTVVPPSTAPSTTTTAPPPVAASLQPILAGARPVAAADPVALASQLVDAETTIRDTAATPEAVDAAGRLAQVAYRALAEHPDWDATVVAEVVAVAPHLRDAVGHATAARREFRSMHRTLSDTLPAWRIVEPLPADQLLALYQEAEARFGVPWYVLAAVNLVETGMGRIQGLSVAGAQGPMQFMPPTWAAYGMGGNVEDPRDAILGAANYLAANGGADGTAEGLDNALFHYNRAGAYVRGVRHYADLMAAEPITLRGFHAWEVVYLSVAGDIVLPSGYEAAARIPVADYLAANPQ